MSRSASLEEVGRRYDAMAFVYDWFGGFERPVRERLLRALDARAGERVLEIGCGTGEMLIPLARAVGATGHVVGVDLSPKMLDQARRKLRREGLLERVTLVTSLDDAAVAGVERFDAVCSCFTLEILEESEQLKVLAACRARLGEKGRVGVAAISSRGDLPQRGLMRLYRWSHRVWPNVVDCRPIDVPDLMARAGFVTRECLTPPWWLEVDVVMGTVRA